MLANILDLKDFRHGLLVGSVDFSCGKVGTDLIEGVSLSVLKSLDNVIREIVPGNRALFEQIHLLVDETSLLRVYGLCGAKRGAKRRVRIM